MYNNIKKLPPNLWKKIDLINTIKTFYAKLYLNEVEIRTK